MRFSIPVYFLALALLLVTVDTELARANEPISVTVTLRDHRFEPMQIEVPANQEIKLVVINADTTPEEFESHDLKIERVIAGKATAEFKLRPLKAGKRYKFFGEFHEATAQGVIVAK